MDQNVFGQKNFFEQKFSGTRIFLGAIIFLTQNFLDPRFFETKIFWIRNLKNNLVKTFFDQKKFVAKKILLQKFFFDF